MALYLVQTYLLLGIVITSIIRLTRLRFTRTISFIIVNIFQIQITLRRGIYLRTIVHLLFGIIITICVILLVILIYNNSRLLLLASLSYTLPATRDIAANILYILPLFLQYSRFLFLIIIIIILIYFFKLRHRNRQLVFL